ncbi:unnamed protein product [Callosobruchus maculatus]|uniref:Uncharacterized protein n=1 Tax=Callosobruchus maculatus TaxID=64391 RepID=A0A653C853_CALMS|nr:unnamed protein product [Callosobruchus maculatus]
MEVEVCFWENRAFGQFSSRWKVTWRTCGNHAEADLKPRRDPGSRILGIGNSPSLERHSPSSPLYIFTPYLYFVSSSYRLILSSSIHLYLARSSLFLHL